MLYSRLVVKMRLSQWMRQDNLERVGLGEVPGGLPSPLNIVCLIMSY